MVSERVVILDDNQVIKVVVYHDAQGTAAEITPQRALQLARQLLDVALRHLHVRLDPTNPPTGLKLSD